jgi:hypothetical protein
MSSKAQGKQDWIAKTVGMGKKNLELNYSPRNYLCLHLHLFDKKVLAFINQVGKYFCSIIILGAVGGIVKCYFPIPLVAI